MRILKYEEECCRGNVVGGIPKPVYSKMDIQLWGLNGGMIHFYSFHSYRLSRYPKNLKATWLRLNQLIHVNHKNCSHDAHGKRKYLKKLFIFLFSLKREVMNKMMKYIITVDLYLSLISFIFKLSLNRFLHFLSFQKLHIYYSILFKKL